MEGTGVCGSGRGTGGALAADARTGAPSGPGDQREAEGAGRDDQVSGTAAGDDTLRPVAPAGFGVGVGSGGRGGASRGRRATGLCRDALDSRAGRGVVAPALHRVEWRLGGVYPLVS